MIEVGLREGVWVLVGVLALYLLVVLFRLARPGRARAAGAARSPQTVRAEAPEEDAEEVPSRPAMPPPVELRPPPVETIDEREFRQMQRELAQLRTEQDFLRSELVALRVDLNELQSVRERPAQQYVHPVSPQHSEAMLLAGRGIAAAQIAEHCGISVAEAELVCALARAGDGT